jgi:succinate-semialdehyde dehydrogenase/glutarate-semialdehyde dehydrogenase
MGSELEGREVRMKTHPLYLNGAWHTSEKTVRVINPANGQEIGQAALVDRARVAQAIQDAQRAFLSWRETTGKARGEHLRTIARELERRASEIARLITLENGKPLAQSAAEVSMTIDHLQWFAEEARRTYGRVIPPQVAGKRHLTIKTPLGVVGAISPWNFPLVLAVRKVAPALAAGCSVILKPARQTPLCALAFAECVDTAKLPPTVFQVVLGSASEIGDEFLSNPLCRKISFTGSTEVGKLLIRGAAEGVKPLSLELGGQAPVLVFEDADLERAVEGVLAAKFRNTGQSCIAANRVYVQRSIYDEFLEALVARTGQLKIGDGFDPEVQIGPLIDEAALNKALEHIEDARRQGARLMCGGRRWGDQKGFYLEPTILADVPDRCLCMREETFAPISPVTMFETEEEAVARANGTVFGLSAYAFTRDLSRAFRLMEKLEAGMIGLNDGVPTTSQAPFGGVKQSGWGRELGSEGIDAFLETKHVSLGI